MDDLKKRVNNLEKAFIAYHTLMMDVTPPAYADAGTDLLCEFQESAESLGSNFDDGFEIV